MVSSASLWMAISRETDLRASRILLEPSAGPRLKAFFVSIVNHLSDREHLLRFGIFAHFNEQANASIPKAICIMQVLSHLGSQEVILSERAFLTSRLFSHAQLLQVVVR
jgi:hypothetical protein